MNISKFCKSSGIIAAVTGLALLPVTLVAQEATTAAPAATVTAPAPAPAASISQPAPVALSSGAAQILRLGQAKISDDTMIAFIQNSGTGFTLNADQIIYLKQQGISDAVINAMLTQPKNGAPSTVVAAAPAPATETPSATTAATATTVYVPSTTYYYYPPLYRNYPYSYDSCWPYPAVSFSLGYRGSWGGGYHGGGYHGGGYHGGGFHGGHR